MLEILGTANQKKARVQKEPICSKSLRQRTQIISSDQVLASSFTKIHVCFFTSSFSQCFSILLIVTFRASSLVASSSMSSAYENVFLRAFIFHLFLHFFLSIILMISTSFSLICFLSVQFYKAICKSLFSVCSSTNLLIYFQFVAIIVVRLDGSGVNIN